jgi:hypothetical protein
MLSETNRTTSDEDLRLLLLRNYFIVNTGSFDLGASFQDAEEAALIYNNHREGANFNNFCRNPICEYALEMGTSEAAFQYLFSLTRDLDPNSDTIPLRDANWIMARLRLHDKIVGRLMRIFMMADDGKMSTFESWLSFCNGYGRNDRWLLLAPFFYEIGELPICSHFFRRPIQLLLAD